MLVLAVLLPALSRYLLQHWHLHTLAKDKKIAQFCGILLAVGSGVVFLATSWVPLVAGDVLASLGASFSVPVRSLITSLVKKDELAAMYTTLSVLTYGGIIFGTPFLTAAFKWGLQSGEFWVGLPFLIAGASFAIATMAVSAAPAETREERLED